MGWVRLEAQVGPWLEASCLVVPEDEPFAAPGQKQVVEPVGVDVEEGDPRALGGQTSGQQGLALQFVGGDLAGIAVVQRGGDFFEKSRGREWRGRAEALIGRSKGDGEVLPHFHVGIGGDWVQPTAFAVRPADLHAHGAIGPCSEDPQRLISGQISTTGYDFLALRDGATLHEDPCTDPVGVAPGAAEADRHARCGGIIAVEAGGLAEVAGHHIEVAVIVQIGQGHGRCDTAIRESPVVAHVLEAQVALVAKGEISGVEPWESGQVAQALFGAGDAAFAGLLSQKVGMLHVMRVTVGHQQIFPAVQIDIEEEGAPGPFSCCQA